MKDRRQVELVDLTAFCGQRHRVTDVEATIVRQAHTIRRALTHQGAAID